MTSKRAFYPQRDSILSKLRKSFIGKEEIFIGENVSIFFKKDYCKDIDATLN